MTGVQTCALPISVIGIDLEGKREVLGFSTGDRENQQAWEALLTDLKNRGLETVDLWISDGGKARINAIESKFLNVKRQRCVRHNMENVLGYIPNEHQELIYPELRAIFYQDNLETLNKLLLLFCSSTKLSILPPAIA